MDCADGEIWMHNNEMNVLAMQIEDSAKEREKKHTA